MTFILGLIVGVIVGGIVVLVGAEIGQRRRIYFITATGIDASTNRRMWVHTHFRPAKDGILPTVSLENALMQVLGWRTCIIVSWTTVPRSWVKYANEEYPIKITATMRESE